MAHSATRITKLRWLDIRHMTSSSVILPGAGMSPRRLQKLEVTPGSDGGAVRVFRIYRWWTMQVRVHPGVSSRFRAAAARKH